MTTPIDRESVEEAASLHQKFADDETADTLLALRAALDAAEAENKRLRDALDRALAEERERGMERAAEIAESRVHSGTGEAAAVHIRAAIRAQGET